MAGQGNVMNDLGFCRWLSLVSSTKGRFLFVIRLGSGLQKLKS